MSRKLFATVIIFCFSLQGALQSQDVKTIESSKENRKIFLLQNENIDCKVIIRDNQLEGDSLTGNPMWLKSFGSGPFTLYTDANFGLQFTWTDWQAPKKIFNADNPVTFDKTDMEITGHKFMRLESGAAEFEIDLHGKNNPLLVKIIYHLDPGTFFFKRKVAVSDTVFGYHFLEKIYSRQGSISGFGLSVSNQSSMMFEESSMTSKLLQSASAGSLTPAPVSILKSGDFGQPVAFTFQQTGAFLGLEYPASNNIAKTENLYQASLECSQDFGMKVGKEEVETDWVVEALVPDVNVKDWFFRYMDAIRVAPAKPYTLYNSWYDLRSPEYPKVQPDHVMNEQNVLNIIRLFRKNMIEKHSIKLDAFVLDDGWDVYQSDWVLRKETFANGLKPIADTLRKMGTSLGLWMGPTGGYSFRMKRIDWMKDHGYEVVGRSRDYEMLCMGGKNYSSLFRKRVTDFVGKDGVGYFKWDGIQFACSEPDHGHPVGIYSRRAILDSVIAKCNAVRSINPATYLNITSGTWLSPWWVKYANQIWMQGADYGYADVPSISERDAAITYRDFVLYDDFKNQDCWYPISNLMTHGIIKGNLERLGGQDDPLDKFTNDVVFYVARGISMIELYISPDLLNDGEWDAIGDAINWAKDRSQILSNTHMIGGDPTNREAYGYVHFKESRGILALRNPAITPLHILVHLSSEYGLDPQASNLVLEKVYPYRWISSKLYASGATIDIPLEGYESAVFEVYPLQGVSEPLVCGAKFDVDKSSENQYSLTVYDAPLGIHILNPEIVNEVTIDGKKTDPAQIKVDAKNITAVPEIKPVEFSATKTGAEFLSKVVFDPSVKEARYAVLLKPDKGYENQEFPSFTFSCGDKDSKAIVQQQKGLWSWYSVICDPDVKSIRTRIQNNAKTKEWKGTASIYLICQQKEEGNKLTLITKSRIVTRPMLPEPFAKEISEKISKLDEFLLTVKEK
jgi:hypothetical protein